MISSYKHWSSKEIGQNERTGNGIQKQRDAGPERLMWAYLN